jgi:hypothetical protein
MSSKPFLKKADAYSVLRNLAEIHAIVIKYFIKISSATRCHKSRRADDFQITIDPILAQKCMHINAERSNG